MNNHMEQLKELLVMMQLTRQARLDYEKRHEENMRTVIAKENELSSRLSMLLALMSK